MATLGLEAEIVDEAAVARTADHLRQSGVVLPTFAQLADPTTIPADIQAALADVDPDTPHPLNLFRVHWHNDDDRRSIRAVPRYIEIPSAFSGVEAKIVVSLGARFPLISAHKVLAAYGCLVPRLVTGQYDLHRHRAVWPSTGNYCRGGVAISRILGVHGIAVLPEGMSKERFDWLDRWVTAPADIIRTVGVESNVKEIYDKCAELAATEENIIFNQFCEFGNHLVHLAITGPALQHIFEDVRGKSPQARLAAFVSATGSGGTIAAGDHLKEAYGTKIVAVEAAECPTLLYNGFGEHNIQGIGDKHVPLIHNVMNTDAVAGISDVHTDTLYVLLNTPAGQAYLKDRRGLPDAQIDDLRELGLSGLCNVLAAIKTARHYRLGADDVLITMATDSGAMYHSEGERALDKYFGGSFDAVDAGETFGRAILGASTQDYVELTETDRRRMFNLGYFTWVEQQGVDIADFEARTSQAYWKGLRPLLPKWDALIEQLNERAQ